jgi:hypothetical protein
MIADAQLVLAEVLAAVGSDSEAHTAAERALRSYERKGHSVGVHTVELVHGSQLSRRH